MPSGKDNVQNSKTRFCLGGSEGERRPPRRRQVKAWHRRGRFLPGRSVGRSVGIHARIIAATRAGTWTTPRFRAGVHHAILICHPDKRAAQGRRDVSDAGRLIISGGPVRRRFLFSARQAVDCF